MRTGLGILGTGLLLAATLASAGCGTACSTVGYVSVITVKLEGNVGAVDEVQLCGDQGCSQRLPAEEPAIPIQTVAPGSSAPQYPPRVPQAAFLSSRKDPKTWEFSVSQSGNPTHVTVRALAASSVLAEQQNDLVWTKADGYGRCPGPVTTPPITLRVP
ncbi:hypothetical protein J2T22_001627 [Pseudarthrobacter defluvii]|uniref:Ig-like domain-containing protein n=1 Tax=Pseudarthrobacter defluvii TaxID=410837 RepID=A0ABT9UJN6_9MICC|nr:hypothetical protein [Pseudarthrobacter defluvii]MDQ0118449.1 hypothetical protein [Pseudarthrobacter defluvii]